MLREHSSDDCPDCGSPSRDCLCGPKHEWRTARFTGAVTCAKCGLMPLDADDYESECEESE